MIPEEMLAVIDAVAECDFSSRPAAIQKLWTKIWGPSTPDITKRTGEVRTDIKVTPSVQVDACPDPAPARVDDVRDRQTEESFLSANTPEAVVEAIEECEWAKMRFPLGTTPLAYIKKLMRRYPKMTPAHVYDAALWVTNNPPKVANRKYLGGFLTNWMKNDGKFASAPHQRRRTPTHQPYTIKASDVGTADIKGPDLFKHAETDDRRKR